MDYGDVQWRNYNQCHLRTEASTTAHYQTPHRHLSYLSLPTSHL